MAISMHNFDNRIESIVNKIEIAAFCSHFIPNIYYSWAKSVCQTALNLR